MGASRVRVATAGGVVGALAGGLLVGGFGVPALAAPTSPKPAAAKPAKPADKPADDKAADDKAAEKSEEKEPPKPPPDTEAPEAPVLGEPAVEPGGEVTLPVTAEDRAVVVVTATSDEEPAGVVVSQSRGTGAVEDLTWTAETGNYSYTVTATDKADNESEAATVDLEVDADPPKINKFLTKPGTARRPDSTVSFVTEARTTYTLRVDDTRVAAGTTPRSGSEPVSAALDLDDGRHPVEVRLEDEAGNVTKRSTSFVVRIEELYVDAELTSEPVDPEQTVEVTATPGTSGTVRIPGGLEQDFRVGKDGTGAVAVALPDGTYEDTRVVVRDVHGRRGVTSLPEIVVDTTPPVLEAEPVTTEETIGKLAVEITADEGSLVDWRVLDASGAEVTAGKYVATGSSQVLTRDLEEGSYTLELSTGDVFDRTTTEQVDVEVAADPITWQTIVAAGVAALIVLLALGFVLWQLWRRQRAKAAERRQRAPVRATEENLAAYRRAEADWVTQHAALSRLAAVARGEVPDDIELPAGFTLLPGETPLWSIGASLLHVAESDGNEVTLEGEPGRLVVTDQRFAFVGDEPRDWWHSMVERLRHLDHEHSLIQLRDAAGWTGFTYQDPQLTQQYADLAVSQAHGRSYAAVVDQGLRAHEMRRPSPPA